MRWQTGSCPRFWAIQKGPTRSEGSKIREGLAAQECGKVVSMARRHRRNLMSQLAMRGINPKAGLKAGDIVSKFWCHQSPHDFYLTCCDENNCFRFRLHSSTWDAPTQQRGYVANPAESCPPGTTWRSSGPGFGGQCVPTHLAALGGYQPQMQRQYMYGGYQPLPGRLR